MMIPVTTLDMWRLLTFVSVIILNVCTPLKAQFSHSNGLHPSHPSHFGYPSYVYYDRSPSNYFHPAIHAPPHHPVLNIGRIAARYPSSNREPQNPMTINTDNKHYLTMNKELPPPVTIRRNMVRPVTDSMDTLPPVTMSHKTLHPVTMHPVTMPPVVIHHETLPPETLPPTTKIDGMFNEEKGLVQHIDASQCQSHGEYLPSADDPCQYLLCTSFLDGWKLEVMPCPPGMAVSDDLNHNGYPCVPDSQTCPQPDLIAGEHMENYQAPAIGTLMDKHHIKNSLMIEGKEVDPKEYFEDIRPYAREAKMVEEKMIIEKPEKKMREYIHGLYDHETDSPKYLQVLEDDVLPVALPLEAQQGYLIVEASPKPESLSVELSKQRKHKSNQNLKREEIEDRKLKISEPLNTEKFQNVDQLLKKVKDPKMTRLKQFVVDTPRMKMAIKESSILQKEERPGYSMHEKTSSTYNKTKTANAKDTGNGGINSQQSHSEVIVESSQKNRHDSKTTRVENHNILNQDVENDRNIPEGIQIDELQSQKVKQLESESRSLNKPNDLSLGDRSAENYVSFVHMPRVSDKLLQVLKDALHQVGG